mgnify:CR=1 FL=1
MSESPQTPNPQPPRPARFVPVIEVCADMVANVLTVVSAVGDQVATGNTMLILESMKMEIPVIVEESGVVLEIRVHEGDVVQEGDVLVVLSSPDGVSRA